MNGPEFARFYGCDPDIVVSGQIRYFGMPKFRGACFRSKSPLRQQRIYPAEHHITTLPTPAPCPRKTGITVPESPCDGRWISSVRTCLPLWQLWPATCLNGGRFRGCTGWISTCLMPSPAILGYNSALPDSRSARDLCHGLAQFDRHGGDAVVTAPCHPADPRAKLNCMSDDDLIAVADFNNQQADGTTTEAVMPVNLRAPYARARQPLRICAAKADIQVLTA